MIQKEIQKKNIIYNVKVNIIFNELNCLATQHALQCLQNLVECLNTRSPLLNLLSTQQQCLGSYEKKSLLTIYNIHIYESQINRISTHNIHITQVAYSVPYIPTCQQFSLEPQPVCLQPQPVSSWLQPVLMLHLHFQLKPKLFVSRLQLGIDQHLCVSFLFLLTILDIYLERFFYNN